MITENALRNAQISAQVGANYIGLNIFGDDQSTRVWFSSQPPTGYTNVIRISDAQMTNVLTMSADEFESFLDAYDIEPTQTVEA